MSVDPSPPQQRPEQQETYDQSQEQQMKSEGKLHSGASCQQGIQNFMLITESLQNS
jgi:hypothetical protein